MRSKEAFAYSRSTGYFCSLAADHPAPCRRRTPRRAGACHGATGMDETITSPLGTTLPETEYSAPLTRRFFRRSTSCVERTKKAPLKGHHDIQCIALGLMPDSGAITNYFALAPVLWGRGLFCSGATAVGCDRQRLAAADGRPRSRVARPRPLQVLKLSMSI